MSLFKRHIARRVAAVGVGVGLLVLGLEAPAFAAPTVSGVAPTSGPANCVVVLTGTGFKDVPQANQTLTFVGPATGAGDDIVVAAANWLRISATEIWAVAPAVVSGTTYTVTLTDPTGGTSTGTFAATTGAGGCAPTIASFAPGCASAGDTVVITGTNLIGSDLAGAKVGFSPYTPAAVSGDPGMAAHTVPDVDEPTSLSVVVPTGAADGKIQVTTAVDTDPNTLGIQGAFSTTNFEVPPPDCAPAGGTPHARSVSLSLRRHLIARGKVSVGDGFTDCAAAVPVKIQRRVSGHWKTVGSTTTSDTGAYKKRIRDRAGKYRAKAPKVSLGTPVTDICSGATSPVRRVT